MLGWAVTASMPVHILLTKADKLKRGPAQSTLLSVREELSTQSELISVQLFSSLKRQGVDTLGRQLNNWLTDSVSFLPCGVRRGGLTGLNAPDPSYRRRPPRPKAAHPAPLHLTSTDRPLCGDHRLRLLGEPTHRSCAIRRALIFESSNQSSTASIAILMISAAVPCMGALIAVRSAACCRWRLRALISGR